MAVVTGGSRGIGRATVLRLADDGTSVVVSYRHQQAADDDHRLNLRATGVLLI